MHRHGESTLDISADLNELGRSNTLVVCSGVKSILDIGRTLEYLVTMCSSPNGFRFLAMAKKSQGKFAFGVGDINYSAYLL